MNKQMKIRDCALSDLDSIGYSIASIGQALYRVFLIRGYSDSQIAICSGLSHHEVGQLISGKGDFTMTRLQDVASNMFWTLTYSINGNSGYQARLSCPTVTYRLSP